MTLPLPERWYAQPGGFVKSYGQLGVSRMFEYLLNLAQLKTDRRAVTALEYGLIAGLIAVVIIGAVTTLGTNLSTIFTTVSGSV
jgi:pilus assembly protein Flp/PilA